MQTTVPVEAQEHPIPLTSIMPSVRMLTALDKLRLIRILAEDLEEAREIFPFEAGKTYHLPTPYNAFGAAAILADGLESSDKGKPVAKTVPISSAEPSWLGCMKDTGKIVGDIMSPAESIE